MNPAVTLAFLRLGKVKPWDAFFYIVAQFIGGVGGVLVAAFFIGQALAHPSVNYVATVPGPAGEWVAFVAEFVMAFFLMLVVLLVSNTPGLARWTGVFAGCLVAIFITFEAPFSGMSMNPARTFASAAVASLWVGLWIYFTAPVAKANDLIHWQTTLVTPDVKALASKLRGEHVDFVSSDVTVVQGFSKGVLVRDPDGHAILLIQE